MQILLNIPDKYVSLDKSFQEMILEMNADGVRGIAKIFTKGHERLIDADELLERIADKSKISKNLDVINGLCGATAIIYDMLIESGQEKVNK